MFVQLAAWPAPASPVSLMILMVLKALVGLRAPVGLRALMALMAEKAEMNLMVAMTTEEGSAVVWTVVETRRQ